MQSMSAWIWGAESLKIQLESDQIWGYASDEQGFTGMALSVFEEGRFPIVV